MRFYTTLKTALAKDFTAYSLRSLAGIDFQQVL